MAKILQEKQSWVFLGLWLLSTTGAWAAIISPGSGELIWSYTGRYFFITIPVILGLLQFFALRTLLEDSRNWWWLFLTPHIVFFWFGLLCAFDLGMVALFAGLWMGTSIAASVVLLFHNAEWGILFCSVASLLGLLSASLINLNEVRYFLHDIPEPVLLLFSLVYSLISGLVLLIGFRSSPEQLEKAAS
jgi:uncharacterized membrane protein (UPF0136 family)